MNKTRIEGKREATGLVYAKPEQMPETMAIEHIPDWEQRLARQDAFWKGEILDRPVVKMRLSKENPDYPKPAGKDFSSHKERWLDAEHVAERALYNMMNTEFLGDALPAIHPNLGPEVFSGYFGSQLEYGPSTAWSVPLLSNWSEADKVDFSTDNFYWKKTVEMTHALLETGRGKFYTGYTDLHPGGDAIAAFRDPLHLNMDMIEHPEEVKSLLAYVDDVFEDVFNYFVDLLQSHGQAISTWPGIVSKARWHVPSNDFSCMISEAMFADFFLHGIQRECDNAEASIYHLDGPNALRHLDALLTIDSLSAIQWVYGSGNGNVLDWLDVYKKCQAAGKAIQLLHVAVSELDTIIENLRPEGVWMYVDGITSRKDADEVIRRVEKWQ